MRLFDRFRKKLSKPARPAAPAAPAKPAAEAASDASLAERFQGARAVPQERVSDLSNRFIAGGNGAGGLRDFARGELDESGLDALSFDELCVVYNNTGWFAGIAPPMRNDAIAFRGFLRGKLLSRLSKMKLYAIYSPETELPIRSSDGFLPLMTDREVAEAVLLKLAGPGAQLQLREIAPENYESTFAELLCAGYEGALLNATTPVKLAELFPSGRLSDYGNTCPDACVRMIYFKQLGLVYRSKAKAEQRGLSEAESGELEESALSAMDALSRCSLLLPAEFENGTPAHIFVPRASFPDGRTYAALFIDQWAVNRYYGEPTSCVSFPNLLRDQCGELAKTPDVTGIIINPGREEFTMSRQTLTEFFAARK